MKWLTPVVAGAAMAVLAGALPARADAPVECSGIGDEQRAMAESVPHTLKLVYARPDGHYLGDVQTRISAGGDEVVNVRCPGPWVLVDLAPGTYEVSATFEGQTKTRRVTVGGDRREQVFTF